MLAIHMYDGLACVAFAQGYAGPPVMMLEHKDETFYVGASVVDFRMNGRRAGRADGARRGNAHLPMYAALGLVSPRVELSREAARAALGLRDEDVLLVSLGYKKKYSLLQLEMVARVLRQFPRARYVAVGPGAEWRPRVQQLGLEKQIAAEDECDKTRADRLHAAADLYLDPFPMTGVISMFESGLAGAAVLSLCPWGPLHRTLCTEATDYADAANQTALLACPSRHQYERALEALLGDVPALRERGRRTRRLLEEVAHGAQWAQRVERFFEWAALQPLQPRDRPPAWVLNKTVLLQR